MEGIALLEHLEHLDGSSDDARCNGVAEQVGTTTLAQHVDDFLATSGKATHGAAECLAQGTGEDVDASIEVKLLGHAVTRLAHDTSRVRLVDHNQRVILLGQITDLVHRRHVAVHREHTVGCDDAEALLLRLLEALLEFGHISIGIAIAFSLAQTHAVDDGRVVQRITDDGVLVGKQSLEQTAVGIEA